MSDLDKLAVLCVVTALSLVQIPLDLRFHQLSRGATLFATATILVIGGIDALLSRLWSALVVATCLSLFVCGCYGLLHRVSPRSLGFGDALLVVPLTFAVAYQAANQVIIWQLLASLSGASHALLSRARSGTKHIPFGPHLLVSAWLVLVFSV